MNVLDQISLWEANPAFLPRDLSAHPSRYASLHQCGASPESELSAALCPRGPARDSCSRMRCCTTALRVWSSLTPQSSATITLPECAGADMCVRCVCAYIGTLRICRRSCGPLPSRGIRLPLRGVHLQWTLRSWLQWTHIRYCHCPPCLLGCLCLSSVCLQSIRDFVVARKREEEEELYD